MSDAGVGLSKGRDLGLIFLDASGWVMRWVLAWVRLLQWVACGGWYSYGGCLGWVFGCFWLGVWAAEN
jgi:hypothetical protein